MVFTDKNVSVRGSFLSVRDRRKRVLYYYKIGFAPSDIVALVASEFGCSERTVWRDWGTRKEWMPTLEPPSESTVEAFLRMSLDLLVLREHILKDIGEYNDYAKVKMCKILMDTLFTEFEYAHNLGIFDVYNRSRMMRNLVNEYRTANGGDELRFGAD